MWTKPKRKAGQKRWLNTRRPTFERLEKRELLAVMRLDVPSSEYEAFALDPMFASVGWLAGTGSEGWTVAGSGVLIAPDWVLTSAHVIMRGDFSGFSNMAFSLSTSIYTDPPHYVFADAWYPYPGYSDTRSGHGVDLGLIHLSQPILDVAPAVLFSGEDERGTLMYMAGYGQPGTYHTGLQPFDGIKRAGSNVAEKFGDDPPHTTAQNQYWMSAFTLYDLNYQPLEWQSSPGDSGGAWFADIDGQMRLVGINNGVYGDYGNGYSFALRTSLYNDWITTTIATHSPAPLGVTVAIADSQPAVVNHNPVHFTVTFSSPVLDFETGDAIVSSVPGDLVTTITPVGTDGTVYNVAVAGITGTGYVTLTVPAGSVTNAAGRTNTASVSLDAGVFYDLTLPEVSAQGLVTNNPAPTLVGTVADNHEVGSVTVVVAGQSVLAAINPDGTWSAVLASPIADGTHNVLVTARDVAGNSATATSVLVVDTVAPVATVNTLVTQTTTPTITGTAGDLTPTSGITSVLVGVAGNSYPALLDANTWSMTLPSALADGRYDVQVQVTDAAGNSSSVTSPGALIVDTRAPVMGGLAASVDAVLRGGQITLTASGVSDPGGQVARVEFYRADVLLGCDEDGTDGWSLTVAVLDWPLGEHALSAIAVDWCEARSDSVGVWVVVGREHPAVELGAVALFADRVRHVALHNDGAEVLTVRSVGPEAAFTISPVGGSAGGEAWTIAPGTSTMFAVSFAAATVGRHAAVVAMIGESDARLVPLGATVLGGWHNGGDVNGDGLVTPLDVLILINEINRDGARTLVPRTIADPGLPLFLDSNADGDVTAADVLAVINMLNWQFRTTSEGESPSPAPLEARDVDSALIELFASLPDETARNGAGRRFRASFPGGRSSLENDSRSGRLTL
jgi:hypothetical protein